MRKLIIVNLLVLLSVSTAQAQFGNGIVFDPTNYRQNLITAIRNVEQVNNQIRQLENDVRMLANQAEDLTSLEFSAGSIVNQKLAEIEQLIKSANSIALSVTEMEAAYARFERSLGQALVRDRRPGPNARLRDRLHGGLADGAAQGASTGDRKGSDPA
mgnify:CR=1 FL=1